MRFSIITPTNLKTAQLKDLYESILAQTYKNWEWIIYLNNGASRNQVPYEIYTNENVIIKEDFELLNSVGYLKNKAFFAASGDILVEVDHDDMLLPECLYELSKAFEDRSIDFVYSNCAILKEYGIFEPYGSRYGWTHTKINYKGKELFVMDTFSPSSHSFSYIWFAPDHVRAWRSTFYKKIGGHDKTLNICDDHDLLIRTYLNGKVEHVPKALYIYRITGQNTFITKNKEIQDLTSKLFSENIMSLAKKDAHEKKLSLVSLGSELKDFIYVDKKNADIVWDINTGLPFVDNSVGVLNASHILQKVKDQRFIMKEIYRVLDDGGWAFIEVPSTDGRGAWQDPTHVSFWNENSFDYYSDESKAALIDNHDIKFQNFKTETIWWDKNVAITRAYLYAQKTNAKRPKLSLI